MIIGKTEIGDEGMHAISKALNSCPVIQKIDVSKGWKGENKIKEATLFELLNVLSNIKNLKELFMSNNY